MARYFIQFSYDGTRYHGWQRQPNGITVQEELEKALTIIIGEKTETLGAGRTDAGVHARMMVAHFDTANEIDEQNMSYRLNRILPPDIAVSNIERVSDDAHARFDAKSRTYQYIVTTKKNPFLNGRADFEYCEMDWDKMNEAASLLKNHIDFTSFSKLHTDVKTNNCVITEAYWRPAGDGVYVFTITADRFLRNMVRAIVGTLLVIGRGKMSVEKFEQIIEAKDRCKAGTSAPAEGLYLTDVSY